jgi:hypothetical protein
LSANVFFYIWTTVVRTIRIQTLAEYCIYGLEEQMRPQTAFRKLGIGLTLAIILSSMLSVAAYAQTGDITVQATRLGGNHVGIKITFPTEIKGRYLVMLGGKSFDCEVIPTNVIYCLGSHQVGAGSILYLVDLDTQEIILKRVLYLPVTKAPPEVDWSLYDFTSGGSSSNTDSDPTTDPPTDPFGGPAPFPF